MKERIPFYVELADHIEENKTFNLSEDSGQYPTIHWLIARSMLDGLSEFDRHQLLTHTASKVKACFENAIAHLQDRGVIVYRSRGLGKRNISFITTDPKYNDGQKLDYRRQTNNLSNTVNAYINNVKKMHPDKIQMVDSAKRFGTKLISQMEE